ncbi:MAG: hypothetical protein A2360_03810 [Candidatus Staskawiczbacteria bacterium RIFOXYB1_FULL_32_11]|uniref:Uncharacterized protein n=1 Tax=Candidatus Staskawiczbacteria bacterium RIFOXYD1_FULL_32_13 TaxID=1802234 RepID=A0A1G2JN82_9BACT|nr:MAG: hypothetical protein UR22_C0001G0064 [Parcubacteria group bacterium GW2011_GWC2_32_10]OGZ77565.1 MAG: hypothetical protein A2256_02280 [Candidatus Staskawiczbacteria bacterium RIFOXYA2_FULL_32_7]OGZ78267.1 MAG: hypothetical protein A2360_03810 [Candidatus Staskawiczbacteria bacterium RIFOXYB1_FULL_32_11]OGZ87246.1 MAG: hypothetical protein A2463_02695 [Candidatus Staskawiczbacteria bacterium RIFOXYC2_FULL_32_10]OGZ87698.1 MAG: hypothetical protein A2561_03330 [Candidatus Staskawiczbacte
MIDLEELSKEDCEDIKTILETVLKQCDFLGVKENRVSIPISDFNNIPAQRVINLCEKIFREEDGIIRCNFPVPPMRREYEGISIKPRDPNSVERDFRNESIEYEQKRDNLEFFINSVNKIKKLFEKINERSQYLICGKIKLNINTGDCCYARTNTFFKPESDEYKLLKALMEKPEIIISYSDINSNVLGLDEDKGKNDREIGFIMRNIKKKLEIIGKIHKNENIFVCRFGYMIRI